MMAVFAVFRENICCKYKSSLFSKAVAVLFIATVLQLVLPLFVAYRTGEFWSKTSTYQEQPNVRFKHEYVFLLETDEIERSVVCGTGVDHEELLRSDCLLKYIEEDSNHDGKPDILHVKLTAPLQTNDKARYITLALLMDVKLDELCTVRAESLIVTTFMSGLPGSKLDIAANVRFVQARALNYRYTDQTKINLEISGETGFQEMIFINSARNISLELTNIREFWTAGHASDEPFELSLKMIIPESTILYQPGVLQLLKWAWIQYFSVFIVFSYLMYFVKRFIFCNNLVWTYKDMPWKAY